MREIVELRHHLHRHPELSNREVQTAAHLRGFICAGAPSTWVTSLGGHGFALVFGRETGPTVLLRCDIDALPINEQAPLPHASLREGVAHKCGHDGHAAILAGVARVLAEHPPRAGRVVVLFQPAEETGAGARRVLADPNFASLQPDYAFACHNLPGYPLGSVVVRSGPFAAGSIGWAGRLLGATSHAGYPEQGRSPVQAVARLICELEVLPESAGSFSDMALLTVVHATIGVHAGNGNVAFGTTPGEAVVMATLRAARQHELERLKALTSQRAEAIARAERLRLTTEWVEEFPTTDNDRTCVEHLRAVCNALGLATIRPTEAFRWSEDFGAFTQKFAGALFGLGAGERQPPLHHPDYDFPDKLIRPGVELFVGLVRRIAG